jgi:hypothetical protein
MLCVLFKSQLVFLNILIELDGTACGEVLRAMQKWKKCCKPKKKGGLGIINLRSQNYALLMKHLDKFYNQKDVPWVKLVQNALYQNGQIPHATTDKGSFWWRDLLKLCDMFRGISSCIVGNGSTVLFKLHMYGTIYVSPPAPFLWIWKSKCCNKLKSFLLALTNGQTQH